MPPKTHLLGYRLGRTALRLVTVRFHIVQSIYSSCTSSRFFLPRIRLQLFHLLLHQEDQNFDEWQLEDLMNEYEVLEEELNNTKEQMTQLKEQNKTTTFSTRASR